MGNQAALGEEGEEKTVGFSQSFPKLQGKLSQAEVKASKFLCLSDLLAELHFNP